MGALLQSKPIDVDVKKDESADVLAIRNIIPTLAIMHVDDTRLTDANAMHADSDDHAHADMVTGRLWQPQPRL